MIACLYGQVLAPFVEPLVRDLCAAAAAAGGAIEPLTVEAAVADPGRGAAVQRLYVLPFDLPPSADLPRTHAALVRLLFPRAEIVTSFAVQDLCWDKVATQELLVARGIPVPDTMVTSDVAEAREFIRRHTFALLKERHSCAGQGHVVVWRDGDTLFGDSGSHQYEIELSGAGPRQVRGAQLIYPAPYYLQRLVADVNPRAVTPGQTLRAYVVDNEIPFWTERYRERYARPSDWIVTAGLGARYRFVQNVSEEARKIALRSAEVMGLRIGAVDLIRTGSAGPYVFDVETDSCHMIIDRQFKHIPEYRDFFDLDRYIARALLVEPEIAPARGWSKRST